MNLKEAFRYQNFLDRLLIENNGVLGSQANLLEVTRLHRRNKSNASAEDETETVEVPELIEPEVSLKFGLQLIEEREKLTLAIDAAKGTLAAGKLDMDAAIEANKYRQSLARQIGTALRSKAGKKVEAVCKTPAGDPVKMLPIRPNSAGLYALIRNQFGIGAFDENGTPLITDPRSIQAMEMADKIYDSGIGLNYNGWDEYEQTVANESVACIPEAVWMIGTIKDKAPQTEGKWAAMDLPAIEGGTYSCSNGGSDLAINAKTPFPEAAKDFCAFAMSDSALQAAGFEKYGLYPSYIPSYEEEIFKTGDPFFGEENVYEIFIENGQKVAQIPLSVNTQEASDYIGTTVSNIFLNGADIQTEMEALQKELETKFN